MTDDLHRELLPGGHIVFAYNAPGDSAYAIESGRVEVISSNGRCLAVLGPGALFGEVALLDEQPRTATVRTLEATTLIRIERSHVHELLKRTDPVIRHLLKLLLERFRNSQPIHSAPTPASALEAEDQEVALRTLILTRDLAFALESEQLELFYQPLIGFSERKLVGFEALVRWRHPSLGMIMPMEFISLAEKTGLIHRLGFWVLNRAINDWATLRTYCQPAGVLPPFVSVNLSAAELGDPHIVTTIRETLAARGMIPHELKIELTETVIIEDRDTVGRVLEDLSALGIAIALDDFGTGYAGLDYLKTLPIACLKIDKTFVQEIATSLRAHEIVQTAINLAWAIGLSTIAEGIEDEETASRLEALGCNVAQGYYFARPMPAEAVAGWLKAAQAEGRIALG